MPTSCSICNKLFPIKTSVFVCDGCYCPLYKIGNKDWAELPEDILRIVKLFVGNYTIRTHYKKLNARYKELSRRVYNPSGYKGKDFVIKETPKFYKVINNSYTLFKKDCVSDIKFIQTLIKNDKIGSLGSYLDRLNKKYISDHIRFNLTFYDLSKTKWVIPSRRRVVELYDRTHFHIGTDTQILMYYTWAHS